MEDNENIETNGHQTISYAAAIQKVSLPRFKKLQPFCRKMFEISPLLSPLCDQFNELWAEFSRYRRKISTYGTILLNKSATAVILCQDYNTKAWTFPAGKVNQGEKGIEAGARETYEETGFDPMCTLGLTKTMKEVNSDLPWDMLNEDHALRYTESDGSGKLRTCFICYGVPDDFPFAPVARKEVSAVEWHKLNDLPKRSFAVAPFLPQLRRWIKKNVKNRRNMTPGKRDKSTSKKRAGSKGKDRGSRNTTPAKSIISDSNDDLIESGLGKVGGENRWSEEEMFKVNEKLIGKKIEYDGNPQIFATKGFDGNDPHAFRVVGGGFMNTGASTIASAPDAKELQPLYRQESGDDSDFQPFFSNGNTPWGEDTSTSLTESKEIKNKSKDRHSNKSAHTSDEKNDQIKSNASGLAILTMLRGDSPIESEPRLIPAVDVIEPAGNSDVFMTDKEITSRSQKQKIDQVERKSKSKIQENEHLVSMKEWVRSLPETKPTEIFGNFKFDVGMIMNAMNVK